MKDQAQPNHKSAYSEFKAKLQECTTTAVCGRSFVLVDKLTEWMKSEVNSGGFQLSRLLAAAYPEFDPVFLPISREQLTHPEDGCLLIFGILLEIGYGRLVDEFWRQEKSDRALPVDLLWLRNTLKELKLPDHDKIADEFDKVQWKYCPVKFDLHMHRKYIQNRIMPFCRREAINDKGGTAKLWQVEIPEAFVGQSLRQAVPSSRFHNEKLGHCYFFALKTFEEGKAGPYINEKNAFIALRQNEGMVRYLGEYEYKELRSSSSQPSKAAETTTSRSADERLKPTYNILLEFGEFDLDEYLAGVLPPVVQTEIEKFWNNLADVADAVEGVHNLKTNTDGKTQAYCGWHADIKPDNILIIQGKFKLADPGFATFVKATNGSDAVAQLAGGTETYGAPERHPGRRGSLNAVPQTIDTWSLGCVFSIAATWVVLGYEGIKQFRKLREHAIEKIVKTPLPQPAGQEKINFSQGDYFHDGVRVLKDVSDWHQMLRKAQRQTDTITSSILDLVDTFMLVEDANERYKAKEVCVALRRIMGDSQRGNRIAVPDNIMEALIMVEEEATANPTASITVEASAPSDKSLTISEERKARASKLLGAPLKKTAHRSEMRSDVSNQAALFSIGVEPMPIGPGTPRRSQDRPRSPQPSRAQYETPMPGDSSNGVSTPPSNSTLSVRRTLASKPSSRKRQNVHQVQEEFKREKGKFFRKFITRKDPFLERYYVNRDIKFVVDNAESMDGHWGETTLLLETLVKKVAGLDEDGVDLMFTVGGNDVANQKGTSKIMSMMRNDKVHPKEGMHTDMATCLGEAFDKYIKEAKRKQNHVATLKRLTLIVLTDGIWAGTFVKEDVRNKFIVFSRALEKIIGELPVRPVSVEFIQFGNDPDATYRLRGLDDDWEYYGIRDIVDTEPCSGDVNKMLLGSFVEEFDHENPEDLSSPGSVSFLPDGPDPSPSNHNSYAGPSKAPTMQTIREQPPRMALPNHEAFHHQNRTSTGLQSLASGVSYPQDLQRQSSPRSSRHSAPKQPSP